jgi:hypothetical protein
MLTDAQRRKIESLKEEFGLSNYEALKIVVEMEKVDTLKTISAMMLGGNFAGMFNQNFQKDFGNVAENISNMLGGFFKKDFSKYTDKKADRDE